MSDTERSRDLRAPIGLRDPGSYSAEIEALRGIAILLVFFFHVDAFLNLGHLRIIGTLVSPWSAFVQAGHTGVTLFFVLSAFLLSRPFLAESTGRAPLPRSRFFARRALRILPLYYAWVLLGTLMTANGLAGLLTGVPYLLFLEPFASLVDRLSPYSDVWWSLATEVQFYLLLPLLALALRSRRSRWIGAGILGVYLLVYTLFATHRLPIEAGGMLKLSLSIFGRGSAFLAGIVAAWIYDRHGSSLRRAFAEQAWLRSFGADALLVGVLLAQGLLLREVVFLGFFTAEIRIPAWHVPEAILWAAFVLAVLLLPLRLKPLLSNKPIQVIGLLSYSLYLCHVSAIHLTIVPLRIRDPDRFGGWTVEAVLVSVGVLLLCLAVSGVTYRVIERPFLARKARVVDQTIGSPPGSAGEAPRV